MSFRFQFWNQKRAYSYRNQNENCKVAGANKIEELQKQLEIAEQDLKMAYQALLTEASKLKSLQEQLNNTNLEIYQAEKNDDVDPDLPTSLMQIKSGLDIGVKDAKKSEEDAKKIAQKAQQEVQRIKSEITKEQKKIEESEEAYQKVLEYDKETAKEYAAKIESDKEKARALKETEAEEKRKQLQIAQASNAARINEELEKRKQSERAKMLKPVEQKVKIIAAAQKESENKKVQEKEDEDFELPTIKDEKMLLKINPSTVTRIGQGLFAKGDKNEIVFKKGKAIANYEGKTLTLDELNQKYPGQDHVAVYAIYSQTQKKYIDASKVQRNQPGWFARHANDCTPNLNRFSVSQLEPGCKKNNARFFDTEVEITNEPVIALVATQDIKGGEEIWAYYGDVYFKEPKSDLRLSWKQKQKINKLPSLDLQTKRETRIRAATRSAHYRNSIAMELIKKVLMNDYIKNKVSSFKRPSWIAEQVRSEMEIALGKRVMNPEKEVRKALDAFTSPERGGDKEEDEFEKTKLEYGDEDDDESKDSTEKKKRTSVLYRVKPIIDSTFRDMFESPENKGIGRTQKKIVEDIQLKHRDRKEKIPPTIGRDVRTILEYFPQLYTGSTKEDNYYYKFDIDSTDEKKKRYEKLSSIVKKDSDKDWMALTATIAQKPGPKDLNRLLYAANKDSEEEIFGIIRKILEEGKQSLKKIGSSLRWPIVREERSKGFQKDIKTLLERRGDNYGIEKIGRSYRLKKREKDRSVSSAPVSGDRSEKKKKTKTPTKEASTPLFKTTLENALNKSEPEILEVIINYLRAKQKQQQTLDQIHTMLSRSLNNNNYIEFKNDIRALIKKHPENIEQKGEYFQIKQPVSEKVDKDKPVPGSDEILLNRIINVFLSEPKNKDKTAREISQQLGFTETSQTLTVSNELNLNKERSFKLKEDPVNPFPRYFQLNFKDQRVKAQQAKKMKSYIKNLLAMRNRIMSLQEILEEIKKDYPEATEKELNEWLQDKTKFDEVNDNGVLKYKNASLVKQITDVFLHAFQNGEISVKEVSELKKELKEYEEKAILEALDLQRGKLFLETDNGYWYLIQSKFNSNLKEILSPKIQEFMKKQGEKTVQEIIDLFEKNVSMETIQYVLNEDNKIFSKNANGKWDLIDGTDSYLVRSPKGGSSGKIKSNPIKFQIIHYLSKKNLPFQKRSFDDIYRYVSSKMPYQNSNLKQSIVVTLRHKEFFQTANKWFYQP